MASNRMKSETVMMVVRVEGCAESYECQECHALFSYRDAAQEDDPPEFCPTCGRRVKLSGK